MAKKVRGFIKYTSYSFVDKDPVIDVLRTMRRDTGMTNHDISVQSKVSKGTLQNWFNGKTRRPQFATCAAAAAAMGYDTIPITADARRKLRG